MRHEPKFSVDLLADPALPVGEYDSNQPLNLGQNRWCGRLGAPNIWQLGPWVPGRRTTLEFLPGVWLFGTNSDYVGQTMKTDPMFQVDAHVTRDFTETFWGALDDAWYTGGQSSVNGVSGDQLDNLGFGVTLGNKLNDNLNFTFGYKSTVNDGAPDALCMDNFMVTLVYGWHPLLEGARRLKGEHYRAAPEGDSRSSRTPRYSSFRAGAISAAPRISTRSPGRTAPARSTRPKIPSSGNTHLPVSCMISQPLWHFLPIWVISRSASAPIRSRVPMGRVFNTMPRVVRFSAKSPCSTVRFHCARARA